MKKLTVNHMSFKQLNSLIRESSDNVFELDDVHGQRFIAAGMKNKKIVIK